MTNYNPGTPGGATPPGGRGGAPFGVSPLGRAESDFHLTDYRVLAETSSYAEAQRLVDTLSDERFPVQNTRIIGTDLELVEQVVGRRTNATAALAGAASGVWWGLFIGLALALFQADANVWQVILTTATIGAGWGAGFAFVAHLSKGGKRDFSSMTATRARHYEVQVRAPHLNEAARILGIS